MRRAASGTIASPGRNQAARRRRAGLAAAAALVSLVAPRGAHAQALDLNQGGPVTVTALGGIDWDQKAQTVTAYDQARAVRGAVTVDADRLIAYYRKKANAGGAAPTSPPPASAPGTAPDSAPGSSPAGGAADADATGANEIYRLQAIGHVHIYTSTDQAWGDKAIYDIDQAVLVLTGHALRLTTPTDVVTARDSLEYHPPTHMSVARGDAILTTNDGRRIQADILVGYSAPDGSRSGSASAGEAKSVRPVQVSDQVPAPAPKPGTDPLTSSGKLKKAEAYGDVVVRTPTETVRGDRGVYVTETGIARIVGNVHITRGQNQLNGEAAIVNMHTGLATLTQDPGTRVDGLIVPNDQSAQQSGAQPASTKGGQK